MKDIEVDLFMFIDFLLILRIFEDSEVDFSLF